MIHAAPKERRPRRGHRGFSLLEAVVTSALLLLALALGTGLLVEAQRLFALAPRALADVDPELVMRLLRSDLKAGIPLPPAAGIPGGPLLLEIDGGRVAWLRDEARLLRLSWDPDGTLSGARTALPRGVVSFRWQRLGSRMVAVEIARRAPASLRADRLGTPLWAHREDGVEVLSCSVALRRDE